VQLEKFLKINKRAGWNKSVQDGKFQKINKICCTIIRETKVLSYCIQIGSFGSIRLKVFLALHGSWND